MKKISRRSSHMHHYTEEEYMVHIDALMKKFNIEKRGEKIEKITNNINGKRQLSRC